MNRIDDHFSRAVRAVRAGAALLLLCTGPAYAVMPVNPLRPDFLGAWTIVASRPAPWQTAAFPSDAAEMKRLTGSRLVFAGDRIAAPAPLSCRGPHYQMRDYTTDMLFQGGLTAPRRQAAMLGFLKPTVRTLETGCEGASEFHFVDPGTAMFALNNRIYTVKRDVR